MSAYAFWNNKGGVGKSFLVFICACDYAHRHPNTDVFVIDLCPQGNVSETLLGGYLAGGKAISALVADTPRRTISGYIDARLSSPFRMVDEIEPFISRPNDFNDAIPANLKLLCGDNLLEIQSDAIRQTSQLSIPSDAWRRVIDWVRDLRHSLTALNSTRDSVFFIDCNPSFAVYTQMALAAAEDVVVPFTADDSSRRGIENIVALLFGIGDKYVETYSRISFSKRAREEGLELPKLHTFVSNRVTFYRGEPSSAFRAASANIATLMDSIHKKHRSIFNNPREKPSEQFIAIPDYHSACVVSSTHGLPLHKMRPGPRKVGEEVVQLNAEPLGRYKAALAELIDRL